MKDTGNNWTQRTFIAPLTGQRSWAPPLLNTVFLTDNWLFNTNNDQWITYIIIHEFGHVWDFRSGESLSSGMANYLGNINCSRNKSSLGCEWKLNTEKELPPGNKDIANNYAASGRWEDWAESFANTIYPYYESIGENVALGSIRKKYVLNQIMDIK